MVKGLGLCSLTSHFQQYLSFIVVVSLLVEGSGVCRGNHRPAASH